MEADKGLHELKVSDKTALSESRGCEKLNLS